MLGTAMNQRSSSNHLVLWIVFLAIAIGLPLEAHSQLPSNQRAVSTAAPKRGYTISKETTYFTGPLKPDGTIDFIAAVNEHFAKGVTDSNNAARIIIPRIDPDSLGRGLTDHHNSILSALKVDPAEFEGTARFGDFEYFAREAKIAENETSDIFSAALKRPWTEDEFPDLERWLTAMREPLDIIAKASRLERFYLPYVAGADNDSLACVLLEHVQATRTLARAYAIRANLHMGNGNWQEAWDDILAIKRLGRLVGQGQSAVQVLVGVAITGIACESATRFIDTADTNAVNWEDLLATWQIGPIADTSESLGVSERAMFIQVACQLEDKIDFPVPWVDSGQGEFTVAANKLVVSTMQQMLRSSEADLDDTLRFANKFYDRMVELSTMTDIRARNEAINSFNKDVAADLHVDPNKSLAAQVFFAKPQDPSRQVANVLLSQLLPAVDAVNRAHWRTQASQQVVQLALAARVVQAQTGNLPESLRQLEPLVEESAFVQPSTGDSIQAVYGDRELVIYHWGVNRVDDGGDISQPKPFPDGYYPASPKDWGIRIKE